jgi:nitrate reductase delta subunit
VTRTWEALVRLVTYPDEHTRADVRGLLPALRGTAGAAAIGEFVEVTAGMSLVQLQEQYTAAFDFDPACALDLGWHLFARPRERAAFLAALREDLDRADIAESPEPPDHLTNVLALISRDEYTRAAQLADLVMPAVADIERALMARGSPYVHALAAVYAEVAALVKRAAGSEGPRLRHPRRSGPSDAGSEHTALRLSHRQHPRTPGYSDPASATRQHHCRPESSAPRS